MIFEVIFVAIVAFIINRVGYVNGFRKGEAKIFKTLNQGFENQLNASNYWRDRALLAEQKCNMLKLKAVEIMPAAYLSAWVRASSEIINAGAKK